MEKLFLKQCPLFAPPVTRLGTKTKWDEPGFECSKYIVITKRDDPAAGGQSQKER
jgi:hypothetical protein